MSMPGFSAEVALASRSRRAGFHRLAAFSAHAGAIVPQQAAPEEWGTGYDCYSTCRWAGGTRSFCGYICNYPPRRSILA